MPQRNFSNKVSLPKLPGLQLPVALSTPRTQPSGAGLRRVAVSGMASRGRAWPAPDRVGPGLPALCQGDHVSPASPWFLRNAAWAVSVFIFRETVQQRFSLPFSICLCSLTLSEMTLQSHPRNSFFLRFSYSTMSSFGVKNIPHEHAQGECFLSEPYNPVLCQNNL